MGLRIIFVTESGVIRSPMAKVLASAKARELGVDIECLSRGITVHFPEPINQKAEAVIVSNGYSADDFVLTEIRDEDITDDCLIFAMNISEYEGVISKVATATENNTFVLSDYVGDEIEIIDPYGEDLMRYGLCFEVIRSTIDKLFVKLSENGLI